MTFKKLILKLTELKLFSILFYLLQLMVNNIVYEAKDLCQHLQNRGILCYKLCFFNQNVEQIAIFTLNIHLFLKI